MQKNRCTAIVLAAGSGRRMKSNVAKQYMLLQDKPLIWYALNTIEESSVIDDCILVTAAEDIAYVQEEIVARYGFRKIDVVAAGGEQRYDSVWNALQVIADGGLSVSNVDGYVFIHDGARPFLTEEILLRNYEAVEESGACVTGMPVKDTVKIADEEGYAKQTPDRRNVWQIQTPQVFGTQLITEAYAALMHKKEEAAAKGIAITDDAMVVENFTGHKVRLVQGSYENIKITTPEDLLVAEAFLSNRQTTEGTRKD